MERDVVIIGGGPAGYAAAIRVCQLGGRATLIEEKEIGGTCLNHGCIPLKVLLRAAELMEEIRASRDFGIDYKDLSVDFARLISRKDTIVRGLRSGISMLLDAHGVEVTRGRGRVLSENRVGIEKADGAREELKARKIIVATGARFEKKSGASLRPDEIFALKSPPVYVRIYGSDVIAASLATVLSRLGSKVLLLYGQEGLLPQFDSETVGVLEREMKKAGIELGMVREEEEEGAYVLDTRRHVAMADFSEVELEKNEKGGILVNERMETSLKDLYACGDVTMEHTFTHVAYMEGIVAAENAMGLRTQMDYRAMPIFAHTLPEIAGVGLKEEEARRSRKDIRIGRFYFASSGAAMVLGRRTGLVKVICDGRYGEILGIHMVGPQSSNLISEAALAIRLEATSEDIGQTLHCHPTLSEAVWEASRDVQGKAVHSLSKR